MKTKLLTLALALSMTSLAACNRADNAEADMARADGTAMTDPALTDPAMTDPMRDPMRPDGMSPAGSNPMVGGAAMDANRDIVSNASNSADHTTLVAAVQAADLVDTLQGPGPFTVFAPTNAAFSAQPAGTVDRLLTPRMKGDLTKVLTYHVVSGNLDAAALSSQIQSGNGQAMLTTVEGGTLTVRANPAGGVTVTDAKGNTANVTTADVRQSNGIIHVVDKVLMP